MSAAKCQIKSKGEIDKNQKTICILQVTRLGDLIQTAIAAKEFKSLYPDYRIILIARNQFAKDLDFILSEYFDQIYTFDLKDFFKTTETSISLKDVRNNINNFKETIGTENISALINLSFSKSSSYLSSILKADHKLGPIYDRHSNIVIRDKWSQYLYSNVMRGTLNSFNLIDLFKSIIGVKEDLSETKKEVTIKAKDKIVIHPFASQSKKKWKTNKWIEIVYKTLKDNPKKRITLVGAPNEALDADDIVKSPLIAPFIDRIDNLVGKKSIKELYQLLDDDTLFVGHDSMVSHLSALKGIQTLTLSLGTVRPSETTPYGENNYNIAPKTPCFPCYPDDKCDYFQCHSDIPFQIVQAAINIISTTGELTLSTLNDKTSSFHTNSVNIFKTTFNHLGQQKLVDILDSNKSSKEIFRMYYRMLWNYMLSEKEENLQFPILTDKTHAELLNTLSSVQHLYELCEFGKKYSQYILEEISSETPDLNKIRDYSNKIDEVDKLKSVLAETNPLLKPITDYLTVAKSNLYGDNVVQLTESSFYVYNEGSTSCSVIYELIEKTITEHKEKKQTKRPLEQRSR